MGLLIHEGQLTYGDDGLHLVVDMGEWWFQETGLPAAAGRKRRPEGPRNPDLMQTDFATSSRQYRVCIKQREEL